MFLMIVGLALFLGVHSTRVFAEGFRQRLIDQRGENTWKGLYSLVSLVGFAMIIFGYGQARQSPDFLWFPPPWLAHVNVLFMAVAFVLLAAAYVPGNRIRAAVGHPMVLGVKVWAFGHLIANGELANVVLFGSFLAWAVADFIAARRRDRAQDVQRAATGGLGADALTIAVGLIAWVAFAGWLHLWLIGISPFGGM